VQVFTIGYTKKSARDFFELIKANQIDVLMDVRLYNNTQLAGFSKSRDLEYFLAALCGCDYIWAKQFAPGLALFNDYKNGQIDWVGYETVYRDFLNAHSGFDFFRLYQEKRICLLCAEETPECCHRRLLAEKIVEEYDGVTIRHL
jgi:uncharacterized protein (DUF488 family)